MREHERERELRPDDDLDGCDLAKLTLRDESLITRDDAIEALLERRAEHERGDDDDAV